MVYIAHSGYCSDDCCAALDLSQVKVLVLDEVDSLLQMGFEDQVSGDK